MTSSTLRCVIFAKKKNGAVQLKSASVPSKRVLVTHYEGIIQT
ncbi:unnamed protein product [Oikopleura dioica]|uniref:Uncharacterized protein n=1 Tax=Oikopleura dioica TaxID=34765 RepID=E4XGQ3_OIKDI|nr:unnamed protein product [Oikopleura dioica]